MSDKECDSQLVMGSQLTSNDRSYMDTINSFQKSIKPLAGSRNFGEWYFNMKTLFQMKELWNVVVIDEVDFTRSSGEILNNVKTIMKGWDNIQRRKNVEAWALLLMKTSPVVQSKFKHIEIMNASWAMHILSKAFKRANKLDQLSLTKALLAIEKKSFETCEEYFSRFDLLCEKIIESGCRVDPDMEIIAFVNGLPLHIEDYVVNLMSTSDSTNGEREWTRSELEASIEKERSRRLMKHKTEFVLNGKPYLAKNLRTETFGEKALQANTSKIGGARGAYLGKQRRMLVCWSCGKEGHTKRDPQCPNFNKTSPCRFEESLLASTINPNVEKHKVENGNEVVSYSEVLDYFGQL
jgi:hypothetical protein